MMKIFKRISSAIGTGARAFVALVGVAGITAAVANYAMTQGAGTNFGSIVVSSVHYAQQLLCDPTTPANCGAVKAGNTAVAADVAQVVADPTLLAAVNSEIPTGTKNIGNTGSLAYPIGAVPYTNSATATTTGAVATLAGAASVTTYICGFSVRANATAATTVNIVVSGTISGSLNFTQWVAPAASGIGLAEMIFPQCIPASAANTSIVVTGGAPGAGGINSATAWGYKL